MEKIKFTFEDTKEEVEFFVLEQTRISGKNYILVTDSEEDEAECLILKDTSAAWILRCNPIAIRRTARCRRHGGVA